MGNCASILPVIPIIYTETFGLLSLDLLLELAIHVFYILSECKLLSQLTPQGFCIVSASLLEGSEGWWDWEDSISNLESQNLSAQRVLDNHLSRDFRLVTPGKMEIKKVGKSNNLDL